MSVARLSQEQIAEINENHGATLRAVLEAKLSGGEEVDNSLIDAQGNEAAAVEQNHVANLLHLPQGEQRKEVSMREIMASADAQHNAVLKKPWFVHERTNREKAFARHILSHLDVLLFTVPVRCRDFYLLAEQRLAILTMITSLPNDVYVNCEIPRDAMETITGHGQRKMPFNVRYRLEKNKLPTFAVADYCTGSGKTVMAIMAALSFLCSEVRWKTLKLGFRGLLEDRTREEHSGLCKIDNADKARLARLAIMFVPATTLSHWYKTAQSAVFGVKECFGPATDVVVWRGLASRDQNMQEALDCGKPVLWILPMESESMAAVRKSPHIHYAVRIFDELNVPMRSRYDQPESLPIYTYITQATIESLETSTAGNPRAPLRLAFNGNFASIARAEESIRRANYKGVQEMLDHYCKMRVFAAPEFVRRAVAEAVQVQMPRGMVVHRLTLRTSTLSAIATGSGMVKISLKDLTGQLLGSGVSSDVRDHIKDLVGRAEVVCTDALLRELNEAYEALPAATMAENTSKFAVKRLLDKMTGLFGGTMPNCPVTLEPIPKDRVRVLGCCTAILDAESIACCRNRCPLCRAPIVAVGEIKPEAKAEDPMEGGEAKLLTDDGKRKAEASGSNSDGKRPLKQAKLERAGSPSLRVADDDGDDGEKNEVPPPDASATAAFEARIAELDEQTLDSVDGVLEALKAQVEFEPSSRMLLCFGFEANQRPVVRQIIARIEQEIRGVQLTDVESCVRDYMRMDAAMIKFNERAKFTTPQIFLVNTTNTSSSVQGLDLHQTDLTIVCDNCSLAIQRQAVGRSLRMRPWPAAASADFQFPAKRVIVASVSMP